MLLYQMNAINVFSFTGIEEVSIKEFESHEIPLHRIRYFKRLGQIVWDRTKKVDKIFGSGNQQSSINSNSTFLR
jgi:hypothetical protein